ncbi:MAG: cysteine hydrolase [Candidatus Tectomicrobia bacterium]|nr:cysteine hydrolase [Candidatus Tectomicrobia bacterium]
METRGEELTLQPEETALIIIDMQNGYCSPNGGLARGGADVRNQARIVPNVVALARACRAAGVTIIWVTQEHYQEDVTRKRHRIPSHLDKRGVFPALRRTPDAELVAELRPEMLTTDERVIKHRMSSFYSTTLDAKLQMLGITTLIICGVATNVCVESTVRDAYFRDYDIIVVRDCVASSFPDLHAATLKNVEIYFGRVVSLSELQAMLSASTAAQAARVETAS